MFSCTIIILALSLFSVVKADAARAVKRNLIENGGFEVLDPKTRLPVKWSISGGAQLFNVSDVTPGIGQYAQGITWSNPSQVSQTLSTPLLPNTQYNLEFYLVVEGVAFHDKGCSLNVALGDAKADEIWYHTVPLTKLSLDLDVKQGGEGELTFKGYCDPNAYGLLDDIVLTQV